MAELKSGPVCVYDFTLSEDVCLKDQITKEDIEKLLKSIAKKWTFQKEKGESGYIHYQGRFSLKLKARINKVINEFIKGAHISITSTENHGNMFYVLKDDTRIDGPWSDEIEEVYIPIQVRVMKTLYPWQQKVVDLSKELDFRTIHCIVDTKGNNGKSSLCMYMTCHKLGKLLTYTNDYKDMMRMAMDLPSSKSYLIDMPRAISKDKLLQFYSGVESIKSGYLFDDRYKYKRKFIDSPQVFIFTNKYPDLSLLSIDRWQIWKINDKLELEDIKLADLTDI